MSTTKIGSSIAFMKNIRKLILHLSVGIMSKDVNTCLSNIIFLRVLRLPRLLKQSVDLSASGGSRYRGPIECGAYSSGVAPENRTGVENRCDFSPLDLLNYLKYINRGPSPVRRLLGGTEGL